MVGARWVCGTGPESPLRVSGGRGPTQDAALSTRGRGVRHTVCMGGSGLTASPLMPGEKPHAGREGTPPGPQREAHFIHDFIMGKRYGYAVARVGRERGVVGARRVCGTGPESSLRRPSGRGPTQDAALSTRGCGVRHVACMGGRGAALPFSSFLSRANDTDTTQLAWVEREAMVGARWVCGTGPEPPLCGPGGRRCRPLHPWVCGACHVTGSMRSSGHGVHGRHMGASVAASSGSSVAPWAPRPPP